MLINSLCYRQGFRSTGGHSELSFWEVKSAMQIFDCRGGGVSAPNPHVVQELIVYSHVYKCLRAPNQEDTVLILEKENAKSK